MTTWTSAPANGAIPDLVAQVYETAPQEERRALLAMLLRPLGLLSLAAIGNGIFAHLRLHGGWPEFQPGVEDLKRVRSSDVVALVHHVQQVSVETVHGIAELVKGSPVLAGSATAAMLLALLVQHSRRRRGEPVMRAEDGEARAA
ncbi:MAG: hypothetical protein HZC37_25705 [Burkholderiales bacterium]|nr:hypothetical protein [Burkholderiales bacterium]